MKMKLAIGTVLILLSIFLFFYDFSRMNSALIQLLAILTVISPLLSGKKIAGYLHDSRLARKMGSTASPALLVYLWLFVWLFFLILYVFASMAFSYAIKFIISTMRADYLGIIYAFLMFAGSYYLFTGRYEQRGFVTRWGRMIEKTRKIGKTHMSEVTERVKKFEKYL